MTNTRLPDEGMVIGLLKQGDENALRVIYDRFYDRVFYLAMQFLKSPESAEEIVQDVFLKLWEKRHEIDESRPVEAWLYTVTRNRVINQFRKVAREQACLKVKDVLPETCDFDKTADKKILDREVDILLDQALRQLPEKQREVYRLARLEGYSRNEIAAHLQISALTVKTHMARALISVRSYLEQKGVLTGLFTIFALLVVSF